MKILGLETSCDETAASVAELKDGQISILSNVVSSQIEIHKKYNGVVPEVAAREHVLHILPVIHEALTYNVNTANEIRIPQIANDANGAKPNIDAIAVTVGPGLVTSLLAGVETAKSLAYAWDLPLVAVNHVEGHICANFIGEDSNNQETITKKYPISHIQYPVVILTVSGGHTMLVLMEKLGQYKTIGQTRDDAAGEAFDKAAALLGIGYPGGPAIAARAAEAGSRNKELGISLPRPMIDSLDFDFSFSGLKTAIRYALERDQAWQEKIPEYCAEFQQAIVDVLVVKTIKAAKKYGAKTVMLAGGVAANLELRKQLKEKVRTLITACPEQSRGDSLFLVPELKYTTDNAAMIAAAGLIKAERKEFTPWQDLKVDCNLEL